MTNLPLADPVLRLTIEYADYLNARDLGDLLHDVDEIYDKLLYSTAPFMRDLPTAGAARLRVREISGGSFVVELASGISQVAESLDPTFKAVITGTPALIGLGKLIRNTADWVLDFRRRADDRRLTKAERDVEIGKQKLELIARAQEVVRELSTSRDAADSDTSNSMVLRGASLIVVANTLGEDVEHLQQVVLRSQITSIEVEVVEGDEGE